MLGGDISNQTTARTLVFDFEDLFVPRRTDWFTIFMLRMTAGWWMAYSSSHRLAPNALKVLTSIAQRESVQFLVLEKRWSAITAGRVLARYKVPANKVEILDPYTSLQDYLIQEGAAAFYSSNPRRRINAGPLGMALTRWNDLILPRLS